MNVATIKDFRERILTWGGKNLRSFPWRFDQDPYRVLISEFMLHRTQTRQVIPVYVTFINRYPTLHTASDATVDEISEILKPLGLSWRISGMISALRVINAQFGYVPLDQVKLGKIPSIGEYIAGATVCFTQNSVVPLIDTNIVRVIGRVFGISLVGEARRRKEMRAAIRSACDNENPRLYHYAIIDFAHIVCTVRRPLCSECPLQDLPCSFNRSSLM